MGVRRVVRRDRRARPSTVLEWTTDGALAAASVRIPDGTWVSIEPRARFEAPWGAVDQLWHAATPLATGAGAVPLSALTAVDWTHVDTIPTVAEPGRIPAGAGTAVLNLLATLAREQGVRHLRYDGPYPTEALFLALLESFHPARGDGDPLARFTARDLAWTPAPFTPSFEDEAYVQWRHRIEKVVWRTRAYYREDWGPVRRRAPLRVHDAADGVRCSLWALGAPLEDHLGFAADGTPRVVLAPQTAAGPARPMTAALREGLIAMVVAMSAAPLATAIREVSAPLAFTWGSATPDLVGIDTTAVRASAGLGVALARRLREATTREARAQLVLAALAEMATAVGDALRARAQARLVTATADAQTRALESATEDPDAARAITAAVADLLASSGVDDQPDVEGDEGADREE